MVTTKAERAAAMKAIEPMNLLIAVGPAPLEKWVTPRIAILCLAAKVATGSSTARTSAFLWKSHQLPHVGCDGVNHEHLHVAQLGDRFFQHRQIKLQSNDRRAQIPSLVSRTVEMMLM